MRKKSGNGNGGGRPIGVALPAEALPARPVGTVIKINEHQQQELSAINSELMGLKLQLGDLAFAADDIERRRQLVIEQLRQVGEKLRGTAGQVVQSYGIEPNNPSVGVWNLDIPQGKIERTS